MRFQVDQQIAAEPDAVAAALANPKYYETVGARAKLSAPELLSCDAQGDTVKLRLRYRFVAPLSSAVRAVIEPSKLTWVEESVHDLPARRVRFTMRADHYADRFKAGGEYRCDAGGPGRTKRTVTGDIAIRMPLVGRRVEDVIAAGVREHLASEPRLLEAFLGLG